MIVGVGTVLYNEHLSNIGKSTTIGMNCKIHSHVWLGEGVVIGDNCKIQAFCFLPGGVTLENNVFLGPRVTFTNDKHPPSHGKSWSKTLVMDGAVIGAGVVILPGLTIGSNAVIGAGAVVTKNVPPGETWVGNPAKKIA
jgi:acetyltransferase-like isoleucine patch superfamily enzyme